ncbi:alpha/beta hydrolase family protein [Brevundimonas sp. SL130]|uniref:alpha/beta hydrolase family protein n=1 Tax=Brevundimonas sp. SL130 TaxID=2995143 RepID=UPI00226CE12F|nr:prolyl oligopeptidase family serine peptidase [Brevundimonas sp. SL130]WAC59331.1 prolyl oligopeptidase family serine peptidase [Brevundimonas sp. SL130]
MLRLSAVAFGAALLLNSTSSLAMETAPDAALTIPTIQQLAAFDELSGFAVSPDGKHMAALRGQGEERVALIFDATDLSKAPRVLGSSLMKIQGVSFVKDDVVAISAWQPFDFGEVKTFTGKLFLISVDGGAWRDPLTVIPTRSDSEREQLDRSSANILDRLPNDPDSVLLSVRGDIYKYNVHTHRTERVLRSGERVVGYETDLNGDIRARVLSDRDGEGLYISTEFRNSAGGWDEHIRTHIKDREVFAVAGFTADPNIAYVISNRNRDKAAIFEYNINTRTIGDVVFEHPLFEATGVSVWDVPGTSSYGEIASFSYDALRSESYALLPDLAQLRENIRSALNVKSSSVSVIDPATGTSRTIEYDTDRYFRIVSSSRDYNTAVVWAGSANDPGAYYLLKDRTNLQKLAVPKPDLNPSVLGKTSLVYYKARDGLDIPAFVTKPSEALYGPGPYPTVIHPHGGPWSRDQMEWDSSMWIPLMVSRGYAVIQPQFRGSDGWGTHLWRAGDNEWGQKMQDDLDDATRWAAEQNIAIPNRVAMFGFSYGGYASMVAAVRPNGLYKCAIAGAGVSDLGRIRNQLFDNPYTREAQRDTVSGLSPSTVAAQTSIPILLYHGERDQTAPLEHSQWFYDAARTSGQDVKFVKLPDYGHGPAWTRAIMARQLGLIDDYLRTGCGGSGL